MPELDLQEIVKSKMSTFEKTISSIGHVSIKELPGSLLMATEGHLSIYYAPFNLPKPKAYKSAKILLLGITPGLSQACLAIKSYNEFRGLGMHIRARASFAGPLRIGLIKYLDLLGVNELLKIDSCADLFDLNSELMIATSLIRYPTLYKGRNYTGHTPKIEKSVFLQEAIKSSLGEILVRLNKNTLVIPLGRAVESGLRIMMCTYPHIEKQILWGFPHPSGANAHASKQFKENKKQMISKIRKFF